MTTIDLTTNADIYGDEPGETAAEGDIINGLAGNDTVTIGVNGVTIHGDEGDDKLSLIDAVSGTLVGGIGSDTLSIAGAAANNMMSGGIGDDTYIINVTDHTALHPEVVLELFGEGIDLVVTSNIYVLPMNLENLTGTNENPANVQQLVGNSAANIITGASQTSQIAGEGGDDTIYLNGASIGSYGGSGDDVIYGNGADQTIFGGNNGLAFVYEDGSAANFTSGNDRIFAGGGNDTVNGEDGDDILDGGTGGDTLLGGAGDDTYMVDDAGDTVTETLDNGTDTVRTALASYTLGDHVEQLFGTSASAQLLSGNAGANWMTVQGAQSELIGGEGADLLEAFGARSTLWGDEGDDQIYSSADEALLYGGAGDDYLSSHGFGNEVHGGSGGDQIYLTEGQSHDNAVYGEEGDDVITVRNQTGGLFGRTVVDSGIGSDTVHVTGGGMDIEGGAGNDRIFNDGFGTSALAFSSIDAGDGNDTIEGSHTQGSISCGAGNDIVNIAAGVLTVSGGGGDDRLRLGLSSIESVLNGDAGNDTLEVFNPDTSSPDPKNKNILAGGTGDDTYITNSLFVTITELANEGNDTLRSDAGNLDLRRFANIENATLKGTAALNLTGNAAANRLTGNAGSNVLTGGAGSDMLKGGAGEDTFDFNTITSSNDDTRDWILDFMIRVDRVDLSSLDASTRKSGNQAFSFIGIDTFNKVAGELRTWKFDKVGTVNDYTRIAADVNGDGKADFTVHLKGLVNLTALDFVL